MPNKKVSLIIPVYNTADYLRRCLESAVSQTYANMEIICVDDGSTDGSEKIIDEFAARDKRVIAIHQENRGESNARNSGLRIASGDYIGFMDCDDWIEPDMYESLVTALEAEDTDMAIAGFYREFENTDRTCIEIKNEKSVDPKVFDKKMLLRYLYERDSYRAFAYMWDKLYKKEILYNDSGELILFDESMKLGGDVLYLAQSALNTKRAVYIEKSFYHYLQRADSGFHIPDLARRQDHIRAYQIVEKEFEEKNVESLVIDFIKRMIAYNCSITAELAYRQRDKIVLAECQEKMKKYEKEYKALNVHEPARIEQFEDILRYTI